MDGERFDLVYISHVLHHAHDVEAVLRESHRLLAPGGVLFVIETIDDSPLMRLARALQPSWDDDEVLNRFRYSDCRRLFGARASRSGTAGSSTGCTSPGSCCRWRLRPLELFTPIFIGLETLLHRPARKTLGRPLLDCGDQARDTALRAGCIAPRLSGSLASSAQRRLPIHSELDAEGASGHEQPSQLTVAQNAKLRVAPALPRGRQALRSRGAKTRSPA